MKRIYILFFWMFLMSFAAYTQNLNLSTANGELAASEVVYLQGEPTGGLIGAHVYVTNNSDEAISVKVKKIENYLVNGSASSICWAGECYPPEVYVSPHADTLGAGETNTDGFTGDLHDGNVAGLSSVSYVFFDENNPADSVMVVFNYDITPTSKSLMFSNEEGNIPLNGSVLVGGTPDEQVKAEVFITNNNLETVNVYVRRIVNYEVPGSINQFCWGLCYPPHINQSSVVISIDPGATNNTDFYCDYYPNGTSGISRITYVFINEDDTTDYSSLTINYDIEVTGINELVDSFIDLSDPYPNPADQNVYFNYDINPGKQMKLAMYNLLGTKVMEKVLDPNKSKVSFFTGGLDEGMYFYSVISGNDVLKTQKLIVRH